MRTGASRLGSRRRRLRGFSSSTAFHSSADGHRWDFVRIFKLVYSGVTSVGFLAQAPMGEECVAEFDQIRFSEEVPSNLRDGS